MAFFHFLGSSFPTRTRILITGHARPSVSCSAWSSVLPPLNPRIRPSVLLFARLSSLEFIEYAKKLGIYLHM